ncbi:MAG: hypothetical protein ACI9K1_002546, partial [Arcticibacterium sp.]
GLVGSRLVGLWEHPRHLENIASLLFLVIKRF